MSAAPSPAPSRHPSEIAHDEARDALITGEAVALDLRPASFVLRGAGTMIDFLVYGGVGLGIVLLLAWAGQNLGLDEALARALSIVAIVLALVIVPTTVETLSQGKSLGRLAVGARIVRDDGGAIGLRHAFIRALTGVLEIFFTLGGFAAIVALLDSRSRRLGDLIAGTYSQNERVSDAKTPVFGVPTSLVSWAATADVARLPDGLARRVSQFLSQASALTPTARSRLAAELASETSRYVSPLPAADPELFLAAVSALRREREFAALELGKQGLERLAPVLTGLPRGFPDRG